MRLWHNATASPSHCRADQPPRASTICWLRMPARLCPGIACFFSGATSATCLPPIPTATTAWQTRPCCQRFRCNGDAPAALLPEQEFQQPLDITLVEIEVVERDGAARMRQYGAVEDRDRAVAAFQRDGQRPAAGFGNPGAVSAVPQRGRHEARIERRYEAGGNGQRRGHEQLL